MIGKESIAERPPDFNLPQIPPPMSLLNAVHNTHENRIGSASSPSSSTHQQNNHHQQPNGGSLALGMEMKHQHQTSANSLYGSHDAMSRGMHVKPEIQQQHSTEQLEDASHARSPMTPGVQRSPLSVGNMGGSGSIMDACSRYGISGSVDLASPTATPTSPDGSNPAVYEGSNAAAMAMAQSQQLHNSYAGGNRGIASPHGSHCVPNPFQFSVNSLMRRKYS